MRIVLVTGGSRGIGAALVEAFKAQGDLVSTCARDLNSLKNSSADYKFTCDVTDKNQVRTQVEEVVRRYGRIDVLVCNAGIAPSNSLAADVDDAIWDRVLATNLGGSLNFTKFAAPLMPNDVGRVIYIGSISSFHGSDKWSAYSVSKHALLGLTRSFAKHLAAKRITVNLICPGYVDTEMTDKFLLAAEMNREALIARVPMRRLLDVNEVAATAVFLASDAAKNITGQSIVIDGGLLS